MANDIKTSVIVDFKGNLVRQAKRNEDALKRFSKNSRTHLKGLSRDVRKMDRVFSGMGKKLAGIAVAAKAIRSAGKVIEFDAGLAQLQTDGRASVEQIAELKKKLIELANDPNVRLDKNLLLTGFDKVIAQTGDFPNAMKNLDNMAKFIRATGAAGEDAGAMIAISFKNGVTEATEVMKFLAIQYKQSLTGSVPLREIAATGKGLFSPVTASAGASAQTLSDTGAVAQITIDAVKSADEAAEAIKAFVSALNKPEVRKVLNSAGIKVRQKNSILLRRLPELIPEIYKAAGGDFGLLGKQFGESGVKVFQGFAKPNGAKRLRELAATTADGSSINSAARINAATAKAAIQSLNNKGSQITDYLISNPSKNAAKAIDNFQSSNALTNAKAIAQTVGATAWAPIQAARSLFNLVAKTVVRPPLQSVKEYFSEDNQQKSKVELEIKSQVPVSVKSIQSKNLELTVDTGVGMNGN